MTESKKKNSPYGTVKFTSIDQYHATFPKETQLILQQLRKIIKEVAPKSEEVISYNIPTFKQNKNLVHYAAYKSHIGFYPTSKPLDVFKDELTKYKTSKGAIQFPIEKPLPIALIKKIVKYRMKADAETIPAKSASAKIFIHYHKDGSIWAKGKMLNGEMHGYWEWYRKDGVIMRSGNFDKGKQIGEWITYDKNGKKYKIAKMKISK